jgi:hypothetical protein
VPDLQALKDVLSDPKKLGLDTGAVQKNIFVLAEQHVSPDRLYTLFFYLSSNYALRGGLSLSIAESQEKSLKMIVERADPDNLKDLYRVMYGYDGLKFDQKTAQTQAIQETLAGTDDATFKETYTKTHDLQKSIDMGVPAYLQGLVRRHAKDGKPYTAEEFQKYYSSNWLSEWLDGPLEKKVSTDKKAYTAGAFSRHFGGNWAPEYRTSAEATQVRQAGDGKPYTIAEFESYYGKTWQTEWKLAPELPCQECTPYLETDANNAELVV